MKFRIRRACPRNIRGAPLVGRTRRIRSASPVVTALGDFPTWARKPRAQYVTVYTVFGRHPRSSM
jgi:hypothetical protein